MSTIEHYVFSSRKLTNFNGKNVYKTSGLANDDGKDGALDYFNIGKYKITNFKTELPIFITNGEMQEFDEMNDFIEFREDFFTPKEHTSAVFQDVFSALKKDDSQLYIYLHGFGNNAKKEMNKQVIPMTERYYPHPNNPHSPIGKMIFLTWPSQGFLEYKHGEKEDVSKMARMVTVFMLKLFYFVNNKNNPLFKDWKPKIVLHAQSMGCKILHTSLERLNFLENANIIKKNRLDGFFHRIIMTGADLKVDALNDLPDENGEEIHQLTKRLILFSNKTDFALWISRYIFSSGRRLGRHLKEEDFKNLPPNLELVILERKDVNFIGHNYFTDEPEIAVRLQNFLKNEHFDGMAFENKMRKIVFNSDTGKVLEAQWFA